MGRKKQDPEQSAKRTQILKTAGKMFISQGYSEVSMDALAEAVPVSKRTLYNHFADKKALFTAVMRNRCQLLFSHLEQTLQEKRGVKETLTTIGEHFLDIVLEPEGINIYRTAITQAQQFPEMGKLFYQSGPSRSTAILATYFQKLNKRGELRITNHELAANIFIGMIFNRLQMKCMLGIVKKIGAQEKSAMVRYAVEVFVRGHKA